MSEVAVIEQAVEGQIRSEAFLEKLGAALPEGMSVDKFARVTVQALMEDAVRQSDVSKRIISANRDSLFLAVLKCAQDGLLPDGREAALVKRGDKVAYMPMVQGVRKIAAEHGWTITAHVVCANDLFEHTVEPENIHHKPVAPGAERGPFVAVYATASHRDGRRIQRVLYGDEVAKRRAMATTQQMWDKWEEQQWEKTATHDVFDELPLDPNEHARLVRVLEATVESDPAGVLYGPRFIATEPPPADGKSSGAEDADVVATAVPAAAAEGDPASAAAADFGAAEPDARDQVLADAAAVYVVKVPKDGSWVNGLTLAQILERGEDGIVFFRWALTKSRAAAANKDEELRGACAAFVKVFVPALGEEPVAA